jgi:hypothetical protein
MAKLAAVAAGHEILLTLLSSTIVQIFQAKVVEAMLWDVLGHFATSKCWILLVQWHAIHDFARATTQR